MEKLGHGPGNRLKIKVITRDLPDFRDPAVLLIDQLKEVYIDGDLEPVDTTNYSPKVLRKDYSVALGAGAGGNDPDQGLNTTYVCDAERNYMGYCNPEVDELIERQSREADQERRKRLVWDIERKLAEDGAQPAIYYNRRAACRRSYVNGLTIIVNSVYNDWRMEDVWLDK
jgi:peptide/nickel transport system substrate-binding protein